MKEKLMSKKLRSKLASFGDKLDEKKITAVTAVSAAAPVFLSVGASADSGSIDLTVPNIADSVTAAMLNGILTQMTNLLPVCLPVVVLMLGFRKGISFLISLLRGA